MKRSTIVLIFVSILLILSLTLNYWVVHSIIYHYDLDKEVVRAKQVNSSMSVKPAIVSKNLEIDKDNDQTLHIRG